MQTSFSGVRVAFVSVIALLSVVTPYSSAYAVEYGGLGGKPAHPIETDSRTQSWFILKADPGQVIKDEILIVNNSSQQKEVDLYPADSVAASGGGFALKQAGDAMKQVGGWIKLSQSTIVLKPFEKKTVPFEVQTPKNIGPGEYTGGIMVQEKTSPIQVNNGMTLALRMGVRVYLTISGQLKKTLEFDQIKATVNEQDVDIALPIRNIGNASIDLIDGDLVISDATTGAAVTHFSMKGLQVLQDSPFIFSAKWAKPVTGGEYTIQGMVAYLDENGETIRRTTTSTNLSLPVKTPVEAAAFVATSSPSQLGENSMDAVSSMKSLMKLVLGLVGVVALLIGIGLGILVGWRIWRVPRVFLKKTEKRKEPISPRKTRR